MGRNRKRKSRAKLIQENGILEVRAKGNEWEAKSRDKLIKENGIAEVRAKGNEKQ